LAELTPTLVPWWKQVLYSYLFFLRIAVPSICKPIYLKNPLVVIFCFFYLKNLFSSKCFGLSTYKASHFQCWVVFEFWPCSWTLTQFSTWFLDWFS
jgi:hypothetical protein